MYVFVHTRVHTCVHVCVCVCEVVGVFAHILLRMHGLNAHNMGF